MLRIDILRLKFTRSQQQHGSGDLILHLGWQFAYRFKGSVQQLGHEPILSLTPSMKASGSSHPLRFSRSSRPRTRRDSESVMTRYRNATTL